MNVWERPLRVYMCDLTHDTIILVSDTIPINIGFIASYSKKIHGKAVDIKLFKYPLTAIEAIKAAPPDVLALSNYSWNSNLSERVAGFAKQCNPNVVTVQGGTNFPHEASLQLDFLLSRPHTDIHIELEGEISFSGLIGRVLSARDGGPGVYDAPAILGCAYVAPSTRRSAKPGFVSGLKPDRIRELDDIPSPYLNGMLDHFFDGRLTPFLETNRGCPFFCTFCHTGNEYFNKINMFSIERITEEIKYIAPKVAAHGISNLHIADTNFAMFPRDKEICEILLKSQKEFGWPLQIMSTTGKNNKERVIEITKLLGDTFSVNMSVQSMDPVVLKNIKRSNIKLEHFVAVNKSLIESERSTKGEVIIGLPGETKESFFRGIQLILEAGVSDLCTYSLMLLNGTPFKDPAYRDQFKIVGKYRIVPLNYGEYAGQRVFDVEETSIATKDMSFEDYLSMRCLALMIEVLHNSRPYHELVRYVSCYGVTLFDFIVRVQGELAQAPKPVHDVIAGFLNETRSELWDTEEELVAYYRRDENYAKLMRGEVGGNIIYKYKAMSLAFCGEAWVDFIAQNCKEIVAERIADAKELSKAFQEIDFLSQFIKNKLAGLLNVDGDLSPRSMECPYDILGWRKTPWGRPLSAFAYERPVTVDFEYDNDQLAARADQFKRYGTHVNALSKIITRVGNVESLYRKVQVRGADAETAGRDVDQFIRYTQSN